LLPLSSKHKVDPPCAVGLLSFPGPIAASHFSFEKTREGIGSEAS